MICILQCTLWLKPSYKYQMVETGLVKGQLCEWHWKKNVNKGQSIELRLNTFILLNQPRNVPEFSLKNVLYNLMFYLIKEGGS